GAQAATGVRSAASRRCGATPVHRFSGAVRRQRPSWAALLLEVRVPGPLSDDAIDTMVAHAWEAPSPKSYSIMFHMGGAIRRVGEAETAFQGRGAEHALNINGVWTDPAGDEQEIAWARDFWTDMQPYSTGVYVNLLGDEGEDRVRGAY